jgi:hypothetical protein
LDAFAKAGDLIAAFDGRIFFLLIMVVFEKMDELECTNLIKKYNLIQLWHFTYIYKTNRWELHPKKTPKHAFYAKPTFVAGRHKMSIKCQSRSS